MSQIIERATHAEKRRSNKYGYVYRQPNAVLSTVSAKQVVLRNVNGVIAKFERTKGDRLRRVG